STTRDPPHLNSFPTRRSSDLILDRDLAVPGCDAGYQLHEDSAQLPDRARRDGLDCDIETRNGLREIKRTDRPRPARRARLDLLADGERRGGVDVALAQGHPHVARPFALGDVGDRVRLTALRGVGEEDALRHVAVVLGDMRGSSEERGPR